MSPQAPDLTRVERIFERRLREQGLFPRPIPDGMTTGLNRLRLYRGEVQIAESAPLGFQVSLEVRAVLEHPLAGEAEIGDRITVQSGSVQEALEQCASTYMDVNFPVLRSLFEGKAATGASATKLSGYASALQRTIEWQAYSSNVQLRDTGGQLGGRLIHQAPLLMIFSTLSGLLVNPRLHWCKFYGIQQATGQTFECAIDGRRAPEAEEELRTRFAALPVPGEWEFQQFAVLAPVGAATQPAVAVQQQEAPRKGWWSWLGKS